MRIEVNMNCDDPLLWAMKWNGRCIDKDTGKDIPFLVAADDSTGQIVRMQKDESGHFVKDNSGEPLLVSEIRNIELFVDK